ncbi:hypothetical protein [Paenibacillus konkukensis]|uniref:hypothetical protein n=1 Tax=Paenibacillus konkukensis TaxID=2020716 RepID=UPI00201E6E1E|nr:hypothetical protein [Paenibacillus konkukensis]
MIERYPLPKQGRFLYDVEGFHFKNYEEYVAYNEKPEALRTQILCSLYDKFDFPITIGYAGIKDSQFKLLPFFNHLLNFSFTAHSTSEVKPVTGLIKGVPKEKAKDFLVGHRVRQDGKEQYVILTPFFGNGQISNNDLNVIATWVDFLSKKLQL